MEYAETLKNALIIGIKEFKMKDSDVKRLIRGKLREMHW